MATDVRTGYTQGLRDLANLLDAHPDLPLPHAGTTVAPMLFFPHRSVDQVLTLRDLMTDETTENDIKFSNHPVQIHGLLYGLNVTVYVPTDLAYTGAQVPPSVDPRLGVSA